jgi:AraC-like DNA-binding protein
MHPLIALLPDRLHIRDADESEPSLRGTLAVMAQEVRAVRPGGATVLTRLSDVLVVQAVRSWLERTAEGQAGWLGALRDPQIGQALAAIHRQPGRRWSLESLAASVHLSRSVFSERFIALVGQSPMQYLTRWRMHMASDWLRTGTLSIGEVASRLGYDSEPAFHRAFKRHVGLPPGAFRRRAPALPSPALRRLARG